jgi:hypothetical protein
MFGADRRSGGVPHAGRHAAWCRPTPAPLEAWFTHVPASALPCLQRSTMPTTPRLAPTKPDPDLHERARIRRRRAHTAKPDAGWGKSVAQRRRADRPLHSMVESSPLLNFERPVRRRRRLAPQPC